MAAMTPNGQKPHRRAPAGLASRANATLRALTGVELHRPAAPRVANQQKQRWADPTFDELYEIAARTSSHPHVAGSRPDRPYNLAQLLCMTAGIDGMVGECGCYKGMTSLLLCHYLRHQDDSFRGGGFHVFDSFEGLSVPTPEDVVADGRFGGDPGEFASSLADVRRVLGDFPDVGFHAGWIPDCFADTPAGRWRLVHVDVDLYQPTADALAFFFPRLAPGGVIVCDDYGFKAWPGARNAVDEYAQARGARLLRLSSGQAVLLADA